MVWGTIYIPGGGREAGVSGYVSDTNSGIALGKIEV
jgi:hypothetical protein